MARYVVVCLLLLLATSVVVSTGNDKPSNSAADKAAADKAAADKAAADKAAADKAAADKAAADKAAGDKAAADKAAADKAAAAKAAADKAAAEKAAAEKAAAEKAAADKAAKEAADKAAKEAADKAAKEAADKAAKEAADKAAKEAADKAAKEAADKAAKEAADKAAKEAADKAAKEAADKAAKEAADKAAKEAVDKAAKEAADKAAKEAADKAAKEAADKAAKEAADKEAADKAAKEAADKAAAEKARPVKRGALCVDGCDYEKGSFDYWKVPEFRTCMSKPEKDNAPWCAAGAVNAKDCCAACKAGATAANGKAYTCRFWVHIPEGKCNGKECGKCLLLPDLNSLLPTKSDKNGCGGKKVRIGKNCPAAQNDPHFLGAHNTRFDFNGLPEKNFCLYTDRAMHVNMGMRGYLDSRPTVNSHALVVNGSAVRTWIRQLAVMWTGKHATHSLVLTARDGKEQLRGESGFLASVELDGTPLPRLVPGESRSLAGGKVLLEFVGEERTGPYDVDHYYLSIKGLLELDLKLRPAHPLLQTPDDAQVHINVMFTDASVSSSVHGVMGQTYREGREARTVEFSRLAAMLHHPVSADGAEGKGFLDGQVKDYETSAVTATDCRYSAFNGQQLPISAY
ncbi:unnamed protein product [Closterium sp. Naga37s-1]|nr:unnamed protein product [Closterium sp. Naga37s-1]